MDSNTCTASNDIMCVFGIREWEIYKGDLGTGLGSESMYIWEINFSSEVPSSLSFVICQSALSFALDQQDLQCTLYIVLYGLSTFASLTAAIC